MVAVMRRAKNDTIPLLGFMSLPEVPKWRSLV